MENSDLTFPIEAAAPFAMKFYDRETNQQVSISVQTKEEFIILLNINKENLSEAGQVIIQSTIAELGNKQWIMYHYLDGNINLREKETVQNNKKHHKLSLSQALFVTTAAIAIDATLYYYGKPSFMGYLFKKLKIRIFIYGG